MKEIERHLCDVMCSFVKEHISEIADPWDNLGAESAEDLLNQIKRDPDVAYWALTELCSWGLGTDYHEQFQYDINFEDDFFSIYKLGDRYVKIELPDDGSVVITEVEKVKKLVEVVEWQNKE